MYISWKLSTIFQWFFHIQTKDEWEWKTALLLRLGSISKWCTFPEQLLITILFHLKRWLIWAKKSVLAFCVIVLWYVFFQYVTNLRHQDPIFFLTVASKWALLKMLLSKYFCHTIHAHTHLPLPLSSYLKCISFLILNPWKFSSKMPLLDSPTEETCFYTLMCFLHPTHLCMFSCLHEIMHGNDS